MGGFKRNQSVTGALGVGFSHYLAEMVTKSYEADTDNRLIKLAFKEKRIQRTEPTGKTVIYPAMLKYFFVEMFNKRPHGNGDYNPTYLKKLFKKTGLNQILIMDFSCFNLLGQRSTYFIEIKRNMEDKVEPSKIIDL